LDGTFHGPEGFYSAGRQFAQGTFTNTPDNDRFSALSPKGQLRLTVAMPVILIPVHMGCHRIAGRIHNDKITGGTKMTMHGTCQAIILHAGKGNFHDLTPLSVLGQLWFARL
jgi:hypothetical protein